MKKPELLGERAKLATGQLTLLQQMFQEAAMVGLGESSQATQLGQTIQKFDDNCNLLLTGNSATGQLAIKATTAEEPDHQSAMTAVTAEWATFTPEMEAVASRGSASKATIVSIEEGGAKLMTELERANDLYATKTVRTTMIPVDLMVPVPSTGRWAAGPTMRLAATLAADIINEKQKVLPGYENKETFFGDHCDPSGANREMLEAFSRSDAWVGMGGMGVSAVCESLSILTSSLFLPTASFNAPAGRRCRTPSFSHHS